MFGLDEWIASLGGNGAMALAVAVLLGLRHATDPDHLTAVSALVLSDQRDGARRAGALGLAWGLGHATTLLAVRAPGGAFPALSARSRCCKPPRWQSAESSSSLPLGCWSGGCRATSIVIPTVTGKFSIRIPTLTRAGRPAIRDLGTLIRTPMAWAAHRSRPSGSAWCMDWAGRLG